MTAIVFCGPTIDREEVRALLPDATVLGPAACGDVYRAARKNPDAIGLIDGYFDHRLSVWHKEVLWALSRGQRIYGASSMGALRAAELARLGMVGVGRIYELYASGELEDDDEVAVVHDEAEQGYRPRSEALVNVRSTLEAALDAGAVSAATRSALLAYAKAQFYAERSYAALLRAAPGLGVPRAELGALTAFLEGHGPINQKLLDAREMLARMRADQEQPLVKPAVDFHFADTNAWQVFREKIAAEDAAAGLPATKQGTAATAWLDRLKRADPGLAANVWALALERALALLLADTQGMDPDQNEMRTEAEGFLRERNVLDSAAIRAWMKDNDLDSESFSTLMYDEAQVRRFREQAQRLALDQVLGVLRSNSAYGRFKFD